MQENFMHRWMFLIVSYFHRFCKWKSKIIICIENCTNKQFTEIITLVPDAREYKAMHYNVFTCMALTFQICQLPQIFKRNTHLPHTRISPKTFVLGIYTWRSAQYTCLHQPVLTNIQSSYTVSVLRNRTIVICINQSCLTLIILNVHIRIYTWWRPCLSCL